MSLPHKVPVATLGTPRIGRRRELKFALESYWAGKSSAAELLDAAKKLRAANWQEQAQRGVTKIPSNDFSLYDHVLDTIVLVGAIPAAYGWKGGEVSLDTYFAMARDGGSAGVKPASQLSLRNPPQSTSNIAIRSRTRQKRERESDIGVKQRRQPAARLPSGASSQ